jgi:hypothetical protein
LESVWQILPQLDACSAKIAIQILAVENATYRCLNFVSWARVERSAHKKAILSDMRSGTVADQHVREELIGQLCGDIDGLDFVGAHSSSGVESMLVSKSQSLYVLEYDDWFESPRT